MEPKVGDPAAPSGNGAPTPNAGGNPDPAVEPSLKDVMAAVTGLEAKLTESVGKLNSSHSTLVEDLVRLRKTVKKGQDPAATPVPDPTVIGIATPPTPTPQLQQSSPGVERSLLKQELKTLPEDVQKEILKQHEDGDLTFAQASERGVWAADLLGTAVSAAPVDAGNASPPGVAASATPQKSGPRFENRADWVKWRNEDPVRAREYMQANEDFDPTKLAGVKQLVIPEALRR